MFEREMRDLAHVPRWTILRRQSTQNVAEHAWYVTVYSMEIAQMLEWQGDMALLLRYAAIHDIEEVWTSDIPGPAKRIITNGSVMKEKIAQQIAAIFPQHLATWNAGQNDPAVRAIIKAADNLDAVLYLCDELQRGNRSVGELQDERTPLGANMIRLERSWSYLPWRSPARCILGWEQVLEAIHNAINGYSRILVDKDT